MAAMPIRSPRAKTRAELEPRTKKTFAEATRAAFISRPKTGKTGINAYQSKGLAQVWFPPDSRCDVLRNVLEHFSVVSNAQLVGYGEHQCVSRLNGGICGQLCG